MAKPVKHKGKLLGGAPRTGKWAKQPEDTRLGGRYRGSLIGVGVLGLVFLLGIGGYLFWADSQLRAGLLRQEQEARRRPDWVPLTELPPYARHAFAAVADTTSFARRSQRRGEPLPSVSREMVQQIHQLTDELPDQARGQTMAPLLEARTSPDRLLELYINRVYMGRTENWPLYGVQHASQEFFGKDARRLTVGEAATLAGILLPPRLQDPEGQPGAVGTRRNEVLLYLLNAKKIDEAAYRAARAEPLAFQPGEDYAPMSRPPDWRTSEVPVIRLPEALRPRPDSAGAPAATSPAQ
ncbi:MAG TPA: transglycosylase domain-containing protein [Longimicrobium sp.]|nr:transglycosylase domain-containing protein [Longimicrobium sp.]